MSLYVVYVRPPLNQTWADGRPVLWGYTVQARSEKDARAIVQNSLWCRGMPIEASWPC